MPSPRRFPPPWSVEERPACFIVHDSSGQALGYFYFEDQLRRRSTAKLLSKDEARRMAVNFAKLPELLGRAAADTRGVTRLHPHISRRSAQCPLSPQFRKYRCNALSDVMGHFQTHAPQQSAGDFGIGCQARNLFSSAFASFRSSVSKPSVNQP
jgi:hypothetical protein